MAREIIKLHRYIGGRRGQLEVDEMVLVVDAPVFAEPLVVSLEQVLGIAVLDLDYPTSLVEGAVLPQPQRSYGLRAFYANLAIVFTEAQSQPPPAASTGAWDSSRKLLGLSLRVVDAGFAATLLGDFGIAYLEDIETTVHELERRTR